MKKSIQTEIIIEADKAKVWDILTSFSQYEKWNPFIIRSRGNAVEGSRLVNTMLNGKKEITFKPKILHIREGSFLDWMGSLFFKGIFDGHHYFEIEEAGNNRVKFTQGENFSGFLSGIIFRQIAENTRANFVRMNQALKKEAEK